MRHAISKSLILGVTGSAVLLLLQACAGRSPDSHPAPAAGTEVVEAAADPTPVPAVDDPRSQTLLGAGAVEPAVAAREVAPTDSSSGLPQSSEPEAAEWPRDQAALAKFKNWLANFSLERPAQTSASTPLPPVNPTLSPNPFLFPDQSGPLSPFGPFGPMPQFPEYSDQDTATYSMGRARRDFLSRKAADLSAMGLQPQYYR